MSHVLVSPLNWGLGHATRDIPVIKNLLNHHHDVTIAACGNARSVLEQEFPGCRNINFPDYPISFSGSRFFLPKFVASFPLILKAISDERKHLELILAKDKYDLIVSDNRLGVYSSEIPSVFITHQLHYHLPLVFWPAELLAVALNGFHHGKYRHIIVPDNPPGQTALAGKLSRPGTDATKRRVYFSGILTSTRKRDRVEDLDYLVMVSGPEPQRTRLQKILLDQIPAIEGKRVVLLRQPGRSCPAETIRWVQDHSLCINGRKRRTHESCTIYHLSFGIHVDDGDCRARQAPCPFHSDARADGTGVPLMVL